MGDSHDDSPRRMAPSMSTIAHTPGMMTFSDKTKQSKAMRSESLFTAALVFAFLSFATFVAAAIVEALQIGDPDGTEILGFTDDGETWQNREYAYWRGWICAILQLVALTMAGYAKVKKSTWGWLLHAVLNFVVTVSGMALWMGAVDDEMPWATRYRLIGCAAAFFLIGTIASALSFLSVIRLEVTKLIPIILNEVDAQANPIQAVARHASCWARPGTSDVLNILMPYSTSKAAAGSPIVI